MKDNVAAWVVGAVLGLVVVVGVGSVLSGAPEPGGVVLAWSAGPPAGAVVPVAFDVHVTRYVDLDGDGRFVGNGEAYTTHRTTQATDCVDLAPAVSCVMDGLGAVHVQVHAQHHEAGAWHHLVLSHRDAARVLLGSEAWAFQGQGQGTGMEGMAGASR